MAETHALEFELFGDRSERFEFESYMKALLGDTFYAQAVRDIDTNECFHILKIQIPNSFEQNKKLVVTTAGKKPKKRFLPEDSPFTPDTTLEYVLHWKETHGAYKSCRKELGLPETTYFKKMKKAKELIEEYRYSDYTPTLRDLSFVDKKD